MSMARDDRLLHRMTVTTSAVAVVVFVALAAYFSWSVGVSFLLGVGVGLGSIAVLWRMVSGIGRGEPEGKRGFTVGVILLYVGKYVAIAALFYALVAWGEVSIVALAAGLTLPTAVLCLKEAGRRVNNAVGIEPKTDAASAGESGSETVDSTDSE